MTKLADRVAWSLEYEANISPGFLVELVAEILRAAEEVAVARCCV